MNLKEAFRLQNTIQNFLTHSITMLQRSDNIMTTETTFLRHKVWPEAEDETVANDTYFEYRGHITELISFTMWLLGEKEKLNEAIRAAKQTMPIDIDGECGLNTTRRTMLRLMNSLKDTRSYETEDLTGGYGYRFDADGNQVMYKCGMKKVCKINYDRNAAVKYARELSRKADEVSSEIDRCIINTAVDYEPPFEPDCSFSDVFEQYIAA